MIGAHAIEPILTDDEEAILALNNAHAQELSLLSPARLAHLRGQAFYARRVGAASAFLIAFDQDADYDSWNFGWFCARFPRFAYVDRVAVAPLARGRGLARALYHDLYAAALAAGHERIVCEVNIDPPNPGSDAFHAREGFQEIGQALNPDSGRTVRFLLRTLTDVAP
ncbi:MAG: GNAT family N-acetyltransferase [Alphaproteobacteria bacterium]